MIVTQLLGGLGNQFFQYALGRALAARRGTTLKLDTSALEGNQLRTFALNHFAIEASVLTAAERRELAIPTTSRGPWRWLTARLSSHRGGLKLIRERGFGFDPAVLEAPAQCYLQGYWQSPKYFADVEDIVRREYSFRDALAGMSAKVASHIEQTPAVSVHVRRGDYASNPVTQRYHGTCNPEYYTAAESYLHQRLGKLQLFVFSDDPDWAEQNLKFMSPTVFVRHNGTERDYDDLHLMTLCTHHIIANSTFSWWGAWLSRHADKMVIAPARWFHGASHSIEDLIPGHWIRL